MRKSIFLSVALVALFSFSVSAKKKADQHKRSEGHKLAAGPCQKFECQKAKNKKECMVKKRKCMDKMFEKRMKKAEKTGIAPEQKQRIITRLEKRLQKMEKRKAKPEALKMVKARLARVKSLKEKTAKKN